MSRKKKSDASSASLSFSFPRPALGEPEASARRRGLRFIAGIDEAGRGPLAGPVTAACVVLPADHGLTGLDDSKKLTPAVREALDVQIRAKALAFAVAWSDAERVDAINILEATKEAMLRALAEVRTKVEVELVLVDGNQKLALTLPQRTLVGGDGLSDNVAAASILAKVARDAFMIAQDALYPLYGFAQHKGYGSVEHFAALRAHGPTPLHRRSFRGVLPPEVATAFDAPAQPPTASAPIFATLAPEKDAKATTPALAKTRAGSAS